MLGFQVYPNIELPETIKNTKIRESETKSLIKTKWRRYACTIHGILLDGY